ncbi:MAG: hypothetical protein ACKO1K_10605, partial [Burkholderiales bacterium]
RPCGCRRNEWFDFCTSLNISWLAGCLAARCLWAIGKPIRLVSRLLWMRAAGWLAGDWTAMFRLAVEA